MEKVFDIQQWDEVKSQLKKKYPLLTNADLQWRYSSQEELVEMIADKLGISFKELQMEIDEM